MSAAVPDRTGVPDGAAAAPAPAGTLRLLDPAALQFAVQGDQLRVTVGDEFSVLDVRVVRCFPLSDPERHLSLRDAQGREFGVVADPRQLAPAAQALVAAALARRYLLPAIRQILSARERFGVVEWQVMTDRGRRHFSTRNLREEVVSPAPHRFILKDVDGNRYDVPDFTRLDRSSQALLLEQL